MADITDLPVMTMTDARSIGFAEERSVRAFSADFHEADVPLAKLLGRAAAVITAKIGESSEDLTQLVAELRAKSARRASAF